MRRRKRIYERSLEQNTAWPFFRALWENSNELAESGNWHLGHSAMESLRDAVEEVMGPQGKNREHNDLGPLLTRYALWHLACFAAKHPWVKFAFKLECTTFFVLDVLECVSTEHR